MAVPQQQIQQPIGQLLIAKGVISEDQLRIATQEQAKSPQPLGRLLVRLGFLSEATIRDVLSENLGQESVDLASVVVDSAAVSMIPKEVARRYLLVPLSVDLANKHLTLAIADPDNIIALDQVRALLRDEYRLITLLASESDILRAIDQYYG
ncbi:MAG: secretion system protein E, partial [Sideroxydans sp.]